MSLRRKIILAIMLCLSMGIITMVYFFGSTKTKKNLPLCVALNRILAAADSDFSTIKGSLIPPTDSDDCVNPSYYSKVEIPGTFTNRLIFNAADEVVPTFITTFYQGPDSTLAYHEYLKFAATFMDCEPDWKVADKTKHNKITKSTYVIFSNRHTLVYILYDPKPKQYATMVEVLPAN